ncbi:MAG: TrkH family potassium uptake protein [Bacteroidales bacterium]|nr:TrkH family potassium uptake protein [Bacteroidales bacterium]
MKALHHKLILKVLGMLITLESGAMSVAFVYSCLVDNTPLAYLEGWLSSILFSFFLGASLWFFFRKSPIEEMSKRDGYFIVTFTWIILGMIGALPYCLTGYIPSYIDAVFETISGFTTTGSSILTDVEILPYGILLWRSMTQWLGGLGVVVLAVAILPAFGFGGMHLFAAETTGPFKDKLHPRIKDTAKTIWLVYVFLTFLLIILYVLGGMPTFDAICHAFTTLPSGGFSTKNASMAFFSPYHQWVTILFMYFAGTNMVLFYKFYQKKFKDIIRDEEWIFYNILVLGSILLVFLILFFKGGYELEYALRHGAFQVVSIITTTGLVTADYFSWPVASYSWLLFLLFAGGMAGSTSGGIKMIRFVLIFKAIRNYLRKLIHQRAVIPIFFNQKPVDQISVLNVISITVLYILAYLLGVLIILLIEKDFFVAISAPITVLSNSGPGLGSIGPIYNFSHLHDVTKVLLTILMILGRLEFISVIALFHRSFWKK